MPLIMAAGDPGRSVVPDIRYAFGLLSTCVRLCPPAKFRIEGSGASSGSRIGIVLIPIIRLDEPNMTGTEEEIVSKDAPWVKVWPSIAMTEGPSAWTSWPAMVVMGGRIICGRL